MTKNDESKNTRQVFANIDEELYLAAKARAAEMRVPLRELMEIALTQMLGVDEGIQNEESFEQKSNSIWDDEYLKMQSKQPIGSPVEFSKEEAAKVVKAAFGSKSIDQT